MLAIIATRRFFEMLGNWSMGEYFKRQQIEWFFEFLTEIVGLDPHKIYVSCFIGDEKNNIPRDDEAAQIWQEVLPKRVLMLKSSSWIALKMAIS